MNCNRCSLVKLLAIDYYMSNTHGSWLARRRWRRLATMDQRKLDRSEPCSCGENLHRLNAQAETVKELSKYGDFT